MKWMSSSYFIYVIEYVIVFVLDKNSSLKRSTWRFSSIQKKLCSHISSNNNQFCFQISDICSMNFSLRMEEDLSKTCSTSPVRVTFAFWCVQIQYFKYNWFSFSLRIRWQRMRYSVCYYSCCRMHIHCGSIRSTI